MKNGNKTGELNWYQHEHTLILTDLVHKKTNLLSIITFQKGYFQVTC